MTLISFVIPCYRSEHTIEKVVEEIIQVVHQREGYDYEIICVNDCSPDNVYDVLQKLAEKDSKVKVINLAKNMGKHSAVMAGYNYVKGDLVVNLDDDFQSPVNELWKLIDPVEADECDCAVAKYADKKENIIRLLGSDVNQKMGAMMLGKPKDFRFENLSVYKAFVAQEMANYKNPYPYLEGLMFRVTNRIILVPMELRERGDGAASGFTFKKSVELVFNGFTAFSVKPLRVSFGAGIAFAIFGVIYAIYTIIHRLMNPDMIVGYSSLLVVLLISSGLIMIMLGIIGEYLGRIYICINKSPQYVIRNTINMEESDD